MTIFGQVFSGLKDVLAGLYTLDNMDSAAGYDEWLSNTLYRGKGKEDCDYKKHGLTPPKRATDGTALTSWLDKNDNPIDRNTPKKTQRGSSMYTKDRALTSSASSFSPEPTIFRALSSATIDYDKGNEQKDPVMLGSLGCSGFSGGPANPTDPSCTWFFHTDKFLPYIQNSQPQGATNSHWMPGIIRAVANQTAEDFASQLQNRITNDRGLPIAVKPAGCGTFDVLTIQLDAGCRIKSTPKLKAGGIKDQPQKVPPCHYTPVAG